MGTHMIFRNTTKRNLESLRSDQQSRFGDRRQTCLRVAALECLGIPFLAPIYIGCLIDLSSSSIISLIQHVCFFVYK